MLLRGEARGIIKAEGGFVVPAPAWTPRSVLEPGPERPERLSRLRPEEVSYVGSHPTDGTVTLLCDCLTFYRERKTVRALAVASLGHHRKSSVMSRSGLCRMYKNTGYRYCTVGAWANLL
ncbi:hypothetical protein MPTK1_1g14160 [Marchantia polymorpha subsp. ruderalis]|uniref:Uncharacterized protein n=2 Tax=Marchantia polymorpha TaxID=3197 RepID=A0AAF6AQ04_MARPO|nr:hypothetical protein MARPO_0019s0186 [Marchantia polymorpha]BBM98524.1 hypothetical protein Mp_1g14160 [Marchantia polymorpha subsp. ruderalis]|eukprot:PTQ44795.1 hypothetical protein MARPO_0019s0186 [Marchantia polymorpha]